MHFNDPALKDVVAALLEHLCLRRVHHVTEVHMWLHSAFERHFDRLRDRHGRFARGQRQRHSAESAPKATPLDIRV